MCGIFGYYSSNLDSAKLDTRLMQAAKSLNHRGPDDRGVETFTIRRATGDRASYLSLGHTRLSIIDLTQGGHQPMHSHDDRFTIIFNGEIYNYRELRSELKSFGYEFRTNTDTEVLLKAWEHWGNKCLTRLTGMFAFVIFDKKNQTVTCVRDAFGIKPFFYSFEGGHFAFASELPALKQLMLDKPALNWQRSYDYLVHGDYDSTSDTFYAGVQQLSPGNWLQINVGTGCLTPPQCWWEPQIQERANWQFNDAVEQVREQFLRNILLHLRSDVPLGAALSGGMDSSAVVCAMRYLEPEIPIHTFSFIAESSELSEERWVDQINAHAGAIPHKFCVTAQEMSLDLEDMIDSQAEPFGSTSIYAQYRVYKLARERGITVTLDGQGADEMLAGYIGYPGQRLKSLLETGDIVAAFQFLNRWSEWPGRDRITGLKALVSHLTAGQTHNSLRNFNGNKNCPNWLNADLMRERGVNLSYSYKVPKDTERGRRVIAELGASLSKRGVAAFLRHGDRNSMRFSVESRVPFLTRELAELLLSMPEDFLISSNGETKHVFRSAMRGIVPEDVIYRKDKIGFVTPERFWLMSMSKTIRQWLIEPLGLPIINQSRLLYEFDQIIAGKAPFTGQVWRWVNFCKWYKNNFVK
jgi:asparagine synthase (glutamine-hydrolysing)